MASINEATTTEVQEQVLARRVFDVVFRMNEARIYDEAPYLASESTLRNESDQEVTQSVQISYEDRKVYTFSRGSTTPGVVNTTITTGLPFITDGGIIRIISEIRDEPFQWGVAATMTTSVAIAVQVTVPPRSTVVVKYAGTQGTCSIPYNYTQQDTMSDGQIVRTSHVDGTYNGVSRYGFQLQMDQAQPL